MDTLVEKFLDQAGIVRELRLFDDEGQISNYKGPGIISNNYNAPVQIFNGPVFFDKSSDSLQNFMNKRSLDNDHENTILKRRRIKSEEETFIM